MSKNERRISTVSRFTVSYHFFIERRKLWCMMQISDGKEMSKKQKEGRIKRGERERGNCIREFWERSPLASLQIMSKNEWRISIVSRLTIPYHSFINGKKLWSMMQISDGKEMSKKQKEGRITRGREEEGMVSA